MQLYAMPLGTRQLEPWLYASAMSCPSLHLIWFLLMGEPVMYGLISRVSKSVAHT